MCLVFSEVSISLHRVGSTQPSNILVLRTPCMLPDKVREKNLRKKKRSVASQEDREDER